MRRQHAAIFSAFLLSLVAASPGGEAGPGFSKSARAKVYALLIEPEVDGWTMDAMTGQTRYSLQQTLALRTNFGQVVPGEMIDDSLFADDPWGKKAELKASGRNRTWVLEESKYSLPGNKGTFSVTKSRMCPAILVRSDGRSVHFFYGQRKRWKKGKRDRMGQGDMRDDLMKRLPDAMKREVPGGKSVDTRSFPRYVAVMTSSGPKVAGLGQKVSGADMKECWVMLWWGRWSPVNHCAMPFMAGGEQPERHIVGRRYQGDVPVLLSLQKRPKELKLGQRGLEITWERTAGAVAVLPLNGIRILVADETEAWARSFPREVVKQAQRWAGVLKYFPTGLEEKYALNAPENGLTLKYTVKYADLADDWKTPGRKLAPVSPMYFLAYRYGLPMEFSGTVADMDLPLMSGAYAGIENADGYEVRIPSVLKYTRTVRTARAGGKAPADLRQKLEAEVAKMVEAGHLKPSYFRGHGSMDRDRNTEHYDVFANPGETVFVLSQALPFLPDSLKRRTVQYIKQEIALFHPWQYQHTGFEKGVWRNYFDLEPDFMNLKVTRKLSKYEARMVPRRKPMTPGAYASFYFLWAYAHAADDWSPIEGHVDVLADRLGRLYSNFDWATGTVIRGDGSLDRSEYSVKYGGTQSVNASFALALGGARILSHLNRPEEAAVAEQLAARLLVVRYAFDWFAAHQWHSRCLLFVEKLTPFHQNPFRRETRPLVRVTEPQFAEFAAKDVRPVAMVTSRLTQLRFSAPGTGYYRNSFWGNQYAHSVPELWAFLRATNSERLEGQLDNHTLRNPYWMMSRSSICYGETGNHPPIEYYGFFQLKARGLEARPEDLILYLDAPGCRVGDLYYIHNLTTLLEAYGGAGRD